MVVLGGLVVYLLSFCRELAPRGKLEADVVWWSGVLQSLLSFIQFVVES